MTREVQITFDCADPARLAAFSADEGTEAGFITMQDPEGNEFCLD